MLAGGAHSFVALSFENFYFRDIDDRPEATKVDFSLDGRLGPTILGIHPHGIIGIGGQLMDHELIDTIGSRRILGVSFRAGFGVDLRFSGMGVRVSYIYEPHLPYSSRSGDR